MCSRHGPVTPALSWFTENREFKNLTLNHWPFQGANGVHCEFHVHSTLNFRRIMIYPGILIALLGLALLIWSLVPLISCLAHLTVKAETTPLGLSEILRDPGVYAGLDPNACYMPRTIENILGIVQSLLVMGFGVGSVVAGIRLNRESIDPDVIQQGITFPLGPATNRIQVVERINLKVCIDKNGKATSELLDGIQGVINPSFVFTTQDVKRVGEYRAKYKLSAGQDLAYQAGYLIVKGNPYLTPIRDKNGQGRLTQNDSTPYRTGMKNVVKIGGHIHDHPFFTEKNSKANFVWDKAWCYSVKEPSAAENNEQAGTSESPVWILPVLFESGHTMRLDLTVQINPDYFPGLHRILEEQENVPGKKVWIERARLDHLSHLIFGKPRLEDGAMLSESEEDETKYYDIEWHDAWFHKNGTHSKNLTFNGFKIWFDRKISPDAKVTGKMVLRVPGLASGIQSIEYYSALGNHARRNSKEVPQELLTYIHVDFEIALAKTLLSNFASLPCTEIKESGAPTPKRLQHILNCFHSSTTDGPILIYRVVESQPQLGDEKSDAGRWHWQLFGKRYHQVTPIDFHILIYGHGGQGYKDRIQVETTVMANIDDETAGQAQQTKRIIERILRQALNGGAQLESDHVSKD
jgi:hypothetical protein